MKLRFLMLGICAVGALHACTPSPIVFPPGTIAAETGYKPQLLERRERVAGGQCVVVLRFDPSDQRKFLVEIDKQQSENSSCMVEDAPGKLFVNGEPLQHAESITFGTGTTTCYGPPIPSPPRCVCTRRPCP
jgi:hypothetical protein